MIASLVFFLCSMTSGFCGMSLYLKYRTSGHSLLLWSSICFAGLTANNCMLFIDNIIFPHVDLSFLRIVCAFLGCAALVYYLVKEGIE